MDFPAQRSSVSRPGAIPQWPNQLGSGPVRPNGARPMDRPTARPAQRPPMVARPPQGVNPRPFSGPHDNVVGNRPLMPGELPEGVKPKPLEFGGVKPPAGGGPGRPAQYLTPEQILALRQAREQAQRAFNDARRAAVEQFFAQQTNYRRAQADREKSYRDTMERAPEQYNSRGMLFGGVHRSGVNDINTENRTADQRLTGDWESYAGVNGQGGAHQQYLSDLRSQFEQALADIRAQREAWIATAAASAVSNAGGN